MGPLVDSYQVLNAPLAHPEGIMSQVTLAAVQGIDFQQPSIEEKRQAIVLDNVSNDAYS